MIITADRADEAFRAINITITIDSREELDMLRRLTALDMAIPSLYKSGYNEPTLLVDQFLEMFNDRLWSV